MNKLELDILKCIEEQQEDCIDKIVEIVNIQSVQDTPTLNAPYGERVKEALNKVMMISENLGFSVKIIDDKVGIAEIGEGEEYIGLFGHLDVVPAEGHWNSDPFECTRIDSRIYGRGVLDNKGPIMSCLYAVYALKKCGYSFNKKVRIVFGTNEETGMDDMQAYLQAEIPPVFGWTPDCKFPVVYAERGRLKLKIQSENRDNMHSILNQYFLGKKNSEELIGINVKDEEFGMLEIRDIKLIDNDLEVIISYPACTNEKEIINNIKHTIKEECEIVQISNLNPVFFNKNDTRIQILSNTYQELTGLDGKPVTTTGGTYAKVVPNIFPFGPSFPGQKGIGHMPNEWMEIHDIILCTKIYALSLYRVLEEMNEHEYS